MKTPCTVTKRQYTASFEITMVVDGEIIVMESLSIILKRRNTFVKVQ